MKDEGQAALESAIRRRVSMKKLIVVGVVFLVVMVGWTEATQELKIPLWMGLANGSMIFGEIPAG
jgi:hypothetical protein